MTDRTLAALASEAATSCGHPDWRVMLVFRGGPTTWSVDFETPNGVRHYQLIRGDGGSDEQFRTDLELAIGGKKSN